MVEESSAQDMASGQTRENISRVETTFDSLDAEGTKAKYRELNAVLDGLASAVVHTLEQIPPN
jgi:hypothetical protein